MTAEEQIQADRQAGDAFATYWSGLTPEQRAEHEARGCGPSSAVPDYRVEKPSGDAIDRALRLLATPPTDPTPCLPFPSADRWREAQLWAWARPGNSRVTLRRLAALHFTYFGPDALGAVDGQEAAGLVQLSAAGWRALLAKVPRPRPGK